MKNPAAISLAMMLLLVLLSCTHKTSEQPAPANGCDSNAYRYNEDIRPILQQNCYSCHAAGINPVLDLQDTAALRTYLSYDFRGDGVYGSKFYHCISWAQLAKPMPPTQMLDSCSLLKMSKWIRAGAPMAN